MWVRDADRGTVPRSAPRCLSEHQRRAGLIDVADVRLAIGMEPRGREAGESVAESLVRLRGIHLQTAQDAVERDRALCRSTDRLGGAQHGLLRLAYEVGAAHEVHLGALGDAAVELEATVRRRHLR